MISCTPVLKCFIRVVGWDAVWSRNNSAGAVVIEVPSQRAGQLDFFP